MTSGGWRLPSEQLAPVDNRAAPAQQPGRRLVGAVLAGSLLNPLNSSMLAVALVLLQDHFRVSLATASWLLSSFSLAAAVAQPLMGRFADRFGARRVFCVGLPPGSRSVDPSRFGL